MNPMHGNYDISRPCNLVQIPTKAPYCQPEIGKTHDDSRMRISTTSEVF
jgi:hypothetical protein